MSYTTDQTRLNDLIERALKREDVRNELSKVSIDQDILRKSLLGNASQIWEAAARELAEYDITRRRTEKLKAEAAVPTFFKPLVYIYRWLHKVLLSKSDVNVEMCKELEIAKSKAEEAVIRFGIIPQLRGIINEAFWKSKS